MQVRPERVTTIVIEGDYQHQVQVPHAMFNEMENPNQPQEVGLNRSIVCLERNQKRMKKTATKKSHRNQHRPKIFDFLEIPISNRTTVFVTNQLKFTHL